MRNPSSGDYRPDDQQDEPMPAEINLTEILHTWWRQRVRLILLACLGVVAAGFLFLGLYLRQLSGQEARMVVQIHISGVAEGYYPNGTPFSPADIVAAPVRQVVYERNALQAFLDFDTFNEIFAVSTMNPQSERLRREYQARLADRRLIHTERLELETTYQAELEQRKNGQFTLLMRTPGAFLAWPEPLAVKLLHDVLDVWAEQSRARGSLAFNINVLSGNILEEINLERDDYPILLDRLRFTMERMVNNLNELAAVPGARLLRVGEAEVTLAELRISLQDDLRFWISMMEAHVYPQGLTRDRNMSEAYISKQILRLDQEGQRAQSQIDSIQHALDTYIVSRSGGGAGGGEGLDRLQVAGESFFDKVLAFTAQGDDVSFRRELMEQFLSLNEQLSEISKSRQVYEQILRRLAASDGTPTVNREELELWVKQQITATLSNLRRTLDHMRLLHTEIEQRSLQPSKLYTVVEPIELRGLGVSTLRSDLLIIAFLWACWTIATLVWIAWRGQAR